MTEPPNTPPTSPTLEPPVAPPTVPGVMVASRAPGPPTWATVIGILSIVFGTLGALSKCPGIATPLFIPAMDWFMSAMPEEEMPEGAAQSLSMMAAYAWPIAGVSLLKTIVAVLLICIGIGLLKRRRWAPVWAIRYAVLDIILSLVEGVLGGLAQAAQFEAMQSADPNAFGAASGWMGLFAYGGVAVGVLFSLIWPVFLIVWFRRRTIREQTAAWA